MELIQCIRDGGWEKIPKEDLPAPSSVSAAFPASWLLLEYETGSPAGLPLIQWTRIFKSHSELYLFLQNDMKTMCLEEGCFLGDPSEERTNQSTEMDFLSFFEAWFLQCETFGEFARQSARNALLAATGCFVTDDYKFGCHRVLQAIKDADELDVHITWYETVYTVMSVLKSTRQVIWGLLCPKYRKLTGDKDLFESLDATNGQSQNRNTTKFGSKRPMSNHELLS